MAVFYFGIYHIIRCTGSMPWCEKTSLAGRLADQGIYTTG
jgi:hypothetical protein